jgi:hypothetical protein
MTLPGGEGSKPLQKGGDDDCSNGPVKSRTCRDIPWIILFVVHIFAFFFVAGQATMGGDLKRLTNGADFMGNVCGATGGRLSLYKDADLSQYPYVMYVFNVTHIQLEVAKQAFGDPQVEGSLSALQSVNTSQLMASGSGGGSGAAGADAMKGMLPEPSTMASDLPLYFVPICVKSCTLKTDSGRKAWWKGFIEWGDYAKYNADSTMYDTMTANGLDDAAYLLTYQSMWRTTALAAGIPAASEADCPYPSVYCAPADAEIPGYGKLFELAEYMGAYCLPTAESLQAGADAAAAVAASSAESVGAAAEGLTAAVSDIQKVWWTFIVVGFVSVVIAMAYLVILRFTIGLIVWGSLAAVQFLLVTGAAFMYYRGNECAVATETNLQQLGTCPSGYKMADETQQQAMVIGAAVVAGIAAFYFVLICCIRNKIRLAIALNEVAASFVTQQPYSLAIPPAQLFFVFIYFALWVYLTLYIVSFMSDMCTTCYIDGEYKYTDAYGEDGTYFPPTNGIPGKCSISGVTPAAYLWADWGEDGVGEMKSVDGSFSTANSAFKCRAAATESLEKNYRFWFALFNILWVNEFSIAFTQCSLAGAVAGWYFAKGKEKLLPTYVITGLKNSALYHSGSIALGSLIVALIQLVKYYLEYLAEQQKKAKNKIMEIVFRLLAYVIWCVEKCVKFLNKNAYIQIAILGKKFCFAAKDAFWLIFRNAARIAICAMLAPFVRKFGVLFIMVFTTYFGYQLLMAVFADEISTPYGACFIYLLIGNVVGRLVMNVFGMAVDTALQCFVIDEELNGEVGEHTPSQLKQFLADNKDEMAKIAQKKAGAKTAPADA